MSYKINNYQSMIDFGQHLGALLQAQDVILLDGDLGAGKTTLTKGIAQGLGINRPIKSPTFTLIREYQTGRLPLYHMDMYRLEGAGGADLGLEEYFSGAGVVVIEWSEFVLDQLPSQYLRIKIERVDQNDEQRLLILSAHGKRYQDLLDEL